MRLMRLLGMSEIRSTADSWESESEAKPARSKEHCRETGAHGVVGDGMSGNARSVIKETCPGAGKEQGRSQSPRSSDEADNDRGAKGDRKVET